MNFVWLVKFVLSIVSVELLSLIFTIFENYTVIFFFFLIIRRKETSIIIQSFTWKHKINEFNAEVSIHYWIVSLYSKYVCFYVFMLSNFLNLFGNMLNSKTVKVNNFSFSTKESNPMCTSISMFINVFYINSILFFIR